MRYARAGGPQVLPRFLLGLALGTIPVLLGACGRQAPLPDPAPRQFTTEDGVALQGTLYRPAPATGLPPGLLLVHGPGATAAAWAPFAERARQQGYLVLAYDMRGHGASTQRGTEVLSYKNFTDEDWRAAQRDLPAAKDDLLLAGADPKNLAVLGEGFGASLALLFATVDPAMQAAVLISPVQDEKGIGPVALMATIQDLPVLLVSADGDSYSAASAARLRQAAPGYCEMRSYPGSAHGTDLLITATEAIGQVLLWLKAIIGPHGVAPDGMDRV